MANTFRPYTREELEQAALAYDLDPAFVEAVYAVESSRGRDPNAMTVRSVKRKRDNTLVRGPFQLEDDTTHDLIRKHKLGPVNVDDPDTHLELAMRLMSDLKGQYGGDYRKMAQAYLGGPGGVKNSNAKDELGTSTGTYGNKILAEMESIKGSRSDSPTFPTGLNMLALPAPGAPSAPVADANPLDMLSPFMHGADAGGGDVFGMDTFSMPGPDPDRASWSSLAAANRAGPVSFNLPAEMGGDLPDLSRADGSDIDAYIARLVDDEMGNRDYTNA